MLPEFIMHLDEKFEIIRQPQRRSLVIKLSPDKANRIIVNKSVSHDVITQFLLSKNTWLEKNLRKMADYKNSLPIPKFSDGQLFPVFGEMKYFKIVETYLKKIHFKDEDGFLICYMPKGLSAEANAEELQYQLIKFYKKLATPYLIERGHQLSQLTELTPKQFKIQTARTRWGSCNSQKVINLNWKLIVFPKVLIDYVIIHELCHLKYLNHSQNFWDLVEHHCPNYKEHMFNLKQQTTQAAFLDLFQK